MIESISEAKAHFSAIVDGAQGGRTYVICRAGRPIAMLSPYVKPNGSRRIGLLKGKRKLPNDWYRKDRAGFKGLAFTARQAVALASLPGIHHDPFDRMLIAQAQADGVKLISHDDRLFAYGDSVVGV